MKRCGSWLALAALLALSVPAPFAAALEPCGAGPAVAAACCELDCSLCACCSHLPKSALAPRGAERGDRPAHALAGTPAASPPAPLPFDILHVPKRASRR